MSSNDEPKEKPQEKPPEKPQQPERPTPAERLINPSTERRTGELFERSVRVDPSRPWDRE